MILSVIGFTAWQETDGTDPQSLVADAFMRMNTTAPPIKTGGKGYRRIPLKNDEESDFVSTEFTKEQLDSCALTTTQGRSIELAELYQKHPFLDVVATDEIGAANSDATYYSAIFDYDELALYLQQAAQTEYDDGVAACYNLYAEVADVALMTSDDLQAITADTLRTNIPENRKVYLQLGNRSHRLSTLIIADPEADEISIGFWFFYQ